MQARLLAEGLELISYFVHVALAGSEAVLEVDHFVVFGLVAAVAAAVVEV